VKGSDGPRSVLGWVCEGAVALATRQRPELDPRLLRYLEATEAVLWQGYPKAGSILPLAQIASVVARISLSVFLCFGAMGLVGRTRVWTH